MQAPQPLAPGALFAGDYRVERELARGGMGTLYLVRQVSTGAARVLKLMHARLTGDSRSRDRFIQEARVSARIESDHVVQVLAAGFDDRGVPWLVMEHLRGEDLATALERRGRFSPADAAEILRQLCHALGAAHAAGLVHRDLKPENVFLAQARREGAPFTVKLLDFGIAKVLEEAATAPEAPPGRRYQTSALGTPLWMAPEQAERGEVTTAADVWSLGLLTFAVLAGRSYWKVGDGPTVPLDGLLRELFIDPLEPASVRAAQFGLSVPPGFDAWFARCVCRDPISRVATANEALALLVPILRDAPQPLGVAPYAPLDPWGSAQGTPPPSTPLASRTPDAVQPAAITPATVTPSSPPVSPFASSQDNPLPTTGNRWGAPTPPPTQTPAQHQPQPPSWPPAQPPPTVLAQHQPYVHNPYASNPYASVQPPPGTVASSWGHGTPAPSVMDGRVSIHGAPPPPRPRRGSRVAWVVVGLLLGVSAVGGGVALYLYDREPERPRRPAPRRTPPPPPRQSPTAQPLRYAPPATPEVATLSVGWAHGCAVRSDTAVSCWGWNHFGQLGDGTTIDRASPATVTGLAGAVEVAAGTSHSCARLSNGTVACWGWNAHGELGDGTTSPRPSPALARPLGGVTQVAAGDSFTCARLSNGTVACWGANDVGQLGDGTDLDRPTPTLVPGLTSVVEVAAGAAHACARHASGAVYCWGASSFGQVGDGHLMNHFRPTLVAGLRDAASLHLGPQRSCVVARDGGARCWGRNDAGQLGDGSRVSRTTPTVISALGTVQSLALGGRHACAVDLDRGVRCWGDNTDGQVGDGTASPRPAPTRLPTLSGVRSASLGNGYSCARLTDGGVRCWGSNERGQLGVGGSTDRGLPSPVAVP